MSVSAVFDGGLFKITDAFPFLLGPGWRKLDFSAFRIFWLKSWRQSTPQAHSKSGGFGSKAVSSAFRSLLDYA